MTDENTKYLTEKYESLIHRHLYKGNVMPFWFECGDGWLTLIDELCGDIARHVDNQKRSLDFKKENGEAVDDSEYEQLQVKISQVKEKFGGLRFYTYGGDDYVRGMITFAESMSMRICEYCGNPGKLGGMGWTKTLCDPCREDDERKRQEWDQNYKRSLEEMKAKNV